MSIKTINIDPFEWITEIDYFNQIEKYYLKSIITPYHIEFN